MVDLLVRHLMPKLDFKRASECLLNLSLVGEVYLEQDSLVDIQAEHLDLLHKVGLYALGVI